jgi:hypothetical protein
MGDEGTRLGLTLADVLALPNLGGLAVPRPAISGDSAVIAVGAPSI